LALRVDACVGAAGADGRYLRVGDRGQRRFQHALHRLRIGLAGLAQPLPAAETAAVVLDAYRVALHTAQASSRSSRRAWARAAASPKSATSCSRLRAVSVSPRSG